MKRICDLESLSFPSLEEIESKKEGVCPVQQMLQTITAAHRATCGLGIMCRDGLYQLYTILTDITEKEGREHDIELMKDIAGVMVTCNECELSVTAAKLLLASLSAHEEEWQKHISEKQCSEKICMYSLYIAPEKCTGCGQCMTVCETGAIRGGEGLIHILDRTSCILCGKCENICPEKCVMRAGQNIPRCPEEPILAGSFTKGLGGKRRRPVRKES